MDAYRHVNNAVYFTYLEQVRSAMFFDRRDGSDGGFGGGIVISRHEIDYLRPISFSMTPLRVEAWVEKIRGASFVMRYEIVDNGSVAARAGTTCVLFDFRRNGLRRITPDEREILEAFADEAA